MKVVEAKFNRRFKVEEYEHEDYSLSAIVEDGETGSEVLLALKAEVSSAFVGASTSETVAEVKPKSTKGKGPKKQEKKLGTKPKTNHADDEDTDDEDTSGEDAGDDGESSEDDETANSEDGDDGDDSSDTDEDGGEGSESEEEVEEVKPAKGSKREISGKSATKESGKAPAKEAGKKTFRKKPQSYNREIEQHKEIFSGVLRSVAPDWKKTEVTKARAKKASEQMAGKEFLDEDGEVLSSFKDAVKKLMSAPKAK